MALRLKILIVFVAVLSSAARSQVNGMNLFDMSYVHTIEITFDSPNFWDSLGIYYDQSAGGGAKQYMMADVVIDGNTIDSVGVRQKGFFSNWGASNSLKKPLKIDFPEFVSGKRYDGLKKINLQNGFEDPSMIRDVLSYKMMRDVGVSAPRTAYAKVYLNGRYWGLYIIVEQVDKKFLRNWYGGSDNDGNLFKCIDNTSLKWQGSGHFNYTDEFALKTNKDSNDWVGFVELVDIINNSGSGFEDSIITKLNINKYLKVLATDILLTNWDSYYDHGRNFYLYENEERGLFDWIPWDYNLAISSINDPLIRDYSQSVDPNGNPTSKVLVENIQNTPSLLSSFFNHVCIINDNYFSLSHYEPFIDSVYNLIRPDYMADTNKFFENISTFDSTYNYDMTIAQFDSLFGWYSTDYVGIKPYFINRKNYVTNYLNAQGHSCTSLGLQDHQQGSPIAIFPNPNHGSFTVNSSEIIQRVIIYTMAGQQILNLNPGSLTVDINLDAQSGFYLVETWNSAGERSIGKIVLD